jgi:50S ribosomal protein L16 3-hydroxylase
MQIGMSLQRGLPSLLNTEDTSSFVSHCYPHDLFLVRGPLERLAELCAYSIDEICAMKRALTRVSFWTLDNKQAQMDLHPQEAKKCFDAGMTVYFHDIKWPRTDLWLRAIEQQLGLMPNTTSLSCFAAHHGLGLPYHWDENSNFVCQAYGSKRWKLVPNRTIKNPSLGHNIQHNVNERLVVEAAGRVVPKEITDREVAQVVTMEPGMVMFMPKGMWHSTETASDVSIHFNIQTRWAKWADALKVLVDETPAIYADEEFREPIPHGLSEEDFADEMARKLTQLADSFREKGLHKRVFEKFHAGKHG